MLTSECFWGGAFGGYSFLTRSKFVLLGFVASRSNNGHMIKFQLYNTADSYQCHFAEIATFVVSIAHFMRAYFNYQALIDGQSFSLPKDAGFLNVSSAGMSDICPYS